MSLGKKVLILDDEIINNKVIKRLLETFGMDSCMLTDPTQIFEVLEREKPDLLLLDLMMPVQDGFTTLTMIKENAEYKELPVIILSGEKSEDILARCLKNGAVDYITKPVRKMELEARVSSAIKLAELNKALNNKLLELQSLYKKIDEELDIARHIQMSIVGPKVIESSDYEIVSYLEMANRLGGDFFDVKQKGSKVMGTIADVSGHGVSSSLIVMMLKTLLNSFISEDYSPARLLQILHKNLYKTIPRGYYIALTHFIFDTASKTLAFSNAGLYDAIVLRKNGLIEQFGSKSFAVAFIAKSDFQETEIKLEQGDKVFFHTDGINEALNANGEMYSRERLLKVLTEHNNQCAENIIKTVLKDRKEFICETIPEDDSTIMILSVK